MKQPFYSLLPTWRRCIHRSHLLAAVAVPAILAGGDATQADVLDFSLTLDGVQVNPPVFTTGNGSGTATLDTDTNLFSWNIEFSDLEGAQTAAHFHGAATLCQDAGVRFTLPLGSPIIGSTTVSASEAQEIIDGLWYVNIHTGMYPGGEIRGQVVPTPLSDPLPDVVEKGGLNVRLETLATGLTAPNWATSAPGDSRLFVVDQPGILWAVSTATGDKSVMLDLSERLVSLGVFGEGSFDERGFLGVAFHPDYQENGLLYTYTSEPIDPKGPGADFSTMPEGVDADHWAVITEWQVPSPGDESSVVDPESARVLMRIDEPQFNHNAGCVNFGPDGMLYFSLGDGGGADDQDAQEFIDGPTFGHGCGGNGSDNQTILGTIVRIDPQGNNSANGQYGIPGDNPFVGVSGIDEIYAYGLRNPFRFSFDSASGALLVGDVGQNDIEEINLVTSGGNYGWRHKEGTFYFIANGGSSGYVTDRAIDIPSGLVDPIAQYDHDEGISVIGGFVYRGSGMPWMQGRYVFGEFGRFFDNDGRLFYLDSANVVREFNIAGQEDVGAFVLGMGQDANGELYVLTNGTGVPFESTGEVRRIVPGMDLSVIGDCPGEMTVVVEGATPDGNVAILRANGTGTFQIPPAMTCGGTVLGLNSSVTLVAIVPADATGRAEVTGRVPAAACGRVHVQAIDISTCLTSSVLGL